MLSTSNSLTLTAGAIDYTEGDGPVVIDAATGVGDIDDTNLENGILWLKEKGIDVELVEGDIIE